MRRMDDTEFARMIRQQESSMYKVARGILKNDDDAADAMQEAILSCWEKLDTLREPRYFKTWLTRILIHCCYDILRARKRNVPEEYVPELGEPELGYANAEWRVALERLPEKYRMVIILYYAEGFKTREIAQILEISESAVKARLVKAREQYEKMMKR